MTTVYVLVRESQDGRNQEIIGVFPNETAAREYVTAIGWEVDPNWGSTLRGTFRITSFEVIQGEA
jgi:hypothetical protein